MHLAQKGRCSLIPRMGRFPFGAMKFSTLSLLPVLVISAACGGSGSTDSTTPQIPAETTQSAALPADNEILQKAYDPLYNVPRDFFVDERATTGRSYTVHHVLDASASYEMCTDDLVEAQALEEADNESRAVSGYYVTSYENERYFEFIRELSYTHDVGNVGEPTSPGYARVFKCSHTNRDGVDRALVDGYAGKLNPDRLDADSLQEFAEYFWQFTFFNVTAKKVIASYSDAPGLRHTLLLAFVVNQGTDNCDRIDVVEWHFDVNAVNGEVTRRFETTASFEARLTGGQPALCE